MLDVVKKSPVSRFPLSSRKTPVPASKSTHSTNNNWSVRTSEGGLTVGLSEEDGWEVFLACRNIQANVDLVKDNRVMSSLKVK